MSHRALQAPSQRKMKCKRIGMMIRVVKTFRSILKMRSKIVKRRSKRNKLMRHKMSLKKCLKNHLKRLLRNRLSPNLKKNLKVIQVVHVHLSQRGSPIQTPWMQLVVWSKKMIKKK